EGVADAAEGGGHDRESRPRVRDPPCELSRVHRRPPRRDAEPHRPRIRARRDGGNGMLITDVVTALIEFPLDAPFHPAWARGRNMPALQMVLIRVETDEGVTGIGAAHAGPEAIVAIDRF